MRRCHHQEGCCSTRSISAVLLRARRMLHVWHKTSTRGIRGINQQCCIICSVSRRFMKAFCKCYRKNYEIPVPLKTGKYTWIGMRAVFLFFWWKGFCSSEFCLFLVKLNWVMSLTANLPVREQRCWRQDMCVLLEWNHGYVFYANCFSLLISVRAGLYCDCWKPFLGPDFLYVHHSSPCPALPVFVKTNRFS